MKILILKRDKIGDMLLTTPMLAHLRRILPDAEIHMLANDYNAWVIQDDPNIDKLWIYPRVKLGNEVRPFAVFKQLWQILALRAQRYDFAIAGGGVVSPRAIKRVLKLGAKRSVAFCEGLDLCSQLTDPLPFEKRVHEIDLNLRLLAPLGVSGHARAGNIDMRAGAGLIGKHERDLPRRLTIGGVIGLFQSQIIIVIVDGRLRFPGRHGSDLVAVAALRVA